MTRLPQVLVNNFSEFKLFFKFSVVGASGAVVDLSLLTLLYKVLRVSLPVSVAIGFAAAVINNYTWNVLWTYGHQDHSDQHHVTLSKFLVVSVVGLMINEAIVNLMTALLNESFWLIGKLLAMGLVLFWNFTVNRLWTFRE